MFVKKGRFSPVMCFGCFLIPFLIIGFLVFLMGLIALFSGIPGPTVTVNGEPTTSPEVSIIFGLIFMIFPAIIILPMIFFFKSFFNQNFLETLSKSRKAFNQKESFNSHASSKNGNEISYSSNESTFSAGRCPNCGAAIEKGEKNCYNCGVRI